MYPLEDNCWIVSWFSGAEVYRDCQWTWGMRRCGLHWELWQELVCLVIDLFCCGMVCSISVILTCVTVQGSYDKNSHGPLTESFKGLENWTIQDLVNVSKPCHWQHTWSWISSERDETSLNLATTPDTFRTLWVETFRHSRMSWCRSPSGRFYRRS